MPARDVAYISPATVLWARERAGLSQEEIATGLKSVTPSQVRAWETGESHPTFSQAENLARKLHLPFAILFMPEPPKIAAPIPDLRTIGDRQQHELSLASIEVINDALVRQEWYREYLERHEAKVRSFVGSYEVDSEVSAAANDMRVRLGLDDQLRKECTSWQEFLTAFVKRAEDVGVLVMRSGVVRHDTSRRLNTKEFRGFAVSDKLAPLVFINSTDAKAAQIFTLAHELVHLWIGASGISNPHFKEARTPSRNVIERFCNRVAAECLVPAAGLERIWTPARSVIENARMVARYYRVSVMVALIRAFDLRKISYDTFAELMDAENARFATQESEEKEERGGSFWSSFNARNSVKLAEAVTASVIQGELPFRDGARLLGVRVTTLQKYIELQSAQ